MSSCGYYSCFKGKPTCKHPSNGVLYTDSLRRGGIHPCNLCKSRCKGLYPSQLPTITLNCNVEVVDKDGNCIYSE